MIAERCKNCKKAVVLNKGDVHTLQISGIGAMKITEPKEVDRTCLDFYDVWLHGMSQTIGIEADDACVKKGAFEPKS